MRLSAPKGTRDIKDDESCSFQGLERAAREVFARYGYDEIRTPIFESAELFNRAVGETTDIVEKEMFNFEDRGGRKLALRPEGTAGVVRAYLEHSWDKTGGIKKLFYMGPMFRAERPQAGRFREFWQIGAEYFGNPSAQADADILLLVRDILTGYGLKDFRFLLNTIGCSECRPDYREKLVMYLSEKRRSLCEDCQRRIDKNPLRALDCKIDGPKLSDAPLMQDTLCEACRAHDTELSELLAAVDFKYERAPRMARGLDYYTRTVFEVTSAAIGAQDAVAAGGRYDNLVKSLGGPDVPATGFALGVDRVVRAKQPAEQICEGVPNGDRVFIALAGKGTSVTGFQLLRRCRERGLRSEIGAAEKSLKSQLRWAESWKADRVVIVGEEELKSKKVLVKDMINHKQEEVALEQFIASLGQE